MKRITITYKEGDTGSSRGRVFVLADLRLDMREGTRSVEMLGRPALGPGVLLVGVKDVRKPPKKAPKAT